MSQKKFLVKLRRKNRNRVIFIDSAVIHMNPGLDIASLFPENSVSRISRNCFLLNDDGSFSYEDFIEAISNIDGYADRDCVIVFSDISIPEEVTVYSTLPKG